MNRNKIAALIASTFFLSVIGGANAAGIETLQEKVNAQAAKAGVPAPNVKEELLGKGEKKEASDQKKVNPLKNLPKIDRMVTIPTNGIRAIQGSDGNIMYLIDNGRFAMIGSLVDIWDRKKLSSIDEITDAINHIDLKRMGFSLEKTNHITVGTGGKRVTIFVDPRCGWCHKLLEEINDDSAYLKDFTFDIVILKVLGDDSGVLAEKLACARTSNQMEKFKALLGGGEAINKLEQVDKCNRRIVKDTEVQRLALNINSVPMVITHDKRFVRGKPSDLRLFLDPEEAERAREREEAQQRQLLKDAAEALMAGPEEAGRVPLKKAEQKRVPLHDNK